ncbi:MAG: hypothetical protein WCF99_03395 [Chloroflexales bacterium]
MAIYDRSASLRTLILSLPTVVAVAGQRVFLSAELPAGYDPKAVTTNPALTGPAILVTDRGGRPGITSILVDSIYHAECYAVDQATARALDGLLFTALHDQSSGRIRSVRCTTTGQHLVSPRTNWNIYLSVWQVTSVMA